MLLAHLEPYKLEANEAKRLSREFEIVLAGLQLQAHSREACKALPAQSGCYLWILDLAGERFKVYVGRTNSLRRRVTDYVVGFQIHSPNDFKLRLFEELVLADHPEATLSLYFRAGTPSQNRIRETDYIKLLNPVVNALPSIAPEARAPLEQAFRQYYHASFRDLLAGGT